MNDRMFYGGVCLVVVSFILFFLNVVGSSQQQHGVTYFETLLFAMLLAGAGLTFFSHFVEEKCEDVKL